MFELVPNVPLEWITLYLFFFYFAEPGYVGQADIRFLQGQEEQWFETGSNEIAPKLKDGLLDTRTRWPNPVPYQIESSLCKLFVLIIVLYINNFSQCWNVSEKTM